MSTLFISDLHLSEKRLRITEAFFSFLQTQAIEANALYILGDLFDAWIGDDDDSEFASSTLSALKKYSDLGKKLYFMRGNRDFLVGTAFSQRTGATILTDPAIISLSFSGQDHTALLMHGDSLCTEDSEYQKFRSMVRSDVWQQEILSKPLAERRQLAATLREESTLANSEKSYEIMDVTISEVLRIMKANKQSLLIHGHTHRPAIHPLPELDTNAKRVVLGDWETDGWYLKADDNGLHLEKFAI